MKLLWSHKHTRSPVLNPNCPCITPCSISAPTPATRRTCSEANASRAENDKRNVGVTDREDMDDEIDLSWSTVLKRTFEAYVRGERPNMYGEWLEWDAWWM
jgi:hypothetical protein